MKLQLFKQRIDLLSKNNAILVVAVGALSVVVVALAWDLAVAKRETILVPPMLSKEADIGYYRADADYYKSWALYVAEMVGNLTPGNYKFVADSLGRLFDAASYEKVKNLVLSSGQETKDSGLNFVFDANKVIWQRVNHTAFVQGLLYQVNGQGNPVSKQKYTFQMTVRIEEGRPVLANLQAYVGDPHTIAWEMKHLAAKQQKKDSKS